MSTTDPKSGSTLDHQVPLYDPAAGTPSNADAYGRYPLADIIGPLAAPASRGVTGGDLHTHGGVLPSSDEKAALAGYGGAPSADNPFVTTSGVARTVSTVADLRGIVGANGDAVTLLGYYAAGDKAPRIYDYDAASSAADNGGTVIKPTAASTGRWIMRDVTDLCLKDFGGKEDGVTADTAAFAAAFSSLPEGSTLLITGPAVLASGQTLGKVIHLKCVNGGKIIYTGTTGTAIKYTKSERTNPALTPFSVTEGQTEISPAGFTVNAGDILALKSNTVRVTNADGNYTYGQFVKAVSVSGGVVEVYPAIAEAYQVDDLKVFAPFERLTSDVVIDARANSSAVSLFVVDYATDAEIKAKVYGSGSQNVGISLTGVSIAFDCTAEGITNGYTPLGYGISVLGSCIKGTARGTKCRHVFDIPDRSYVSVGVEVDIYATKSDDADDFVYIAGCHSNALTPKFLTGEISGTGHLLGDRSGSAYIGSVVFDPVNSNATYGCILFTDLAPTTAKVKGAVFRNTKAAACIRVGSVGSTLDVEGIQVSGDKTVLNVDAGYTHKIRVSGAKGSCRAFINNGHTASTLDIAFVNCELDKYSTSSDYMLDFVAPTNLTLRVLGSKSNDTLATGFLRITGAIGGTIDVRISGNDSASTYRFGWFDFTGTPTIDRFSVENNHFSGAVNMGLPTGATFKSMGRFVGNSSLNTSTAPLGTSATPIYVADNSFDLQQQLTLSTTVKAGPGNRDVKSTYSIMQGATNVSWV